MLTISWLTMVDYNVFMSTNYRLYWPFVYYGQLSTTLLYWNF